LRALETAEELAGRGIGNRPLLTPSPLASASKSAPAADGARTVTIILRPILLNNPAMFVRIHPAD
jgi:hypothetical protein